MKKKILLLIVIAVCLMNNLLSQQYKSFPVNSQKDNNVSGIIYSLPQTELVIKFTVERINRTPGIYAQNAYLLGIDNTMLKKSTTYRIIDIDICEKIVANPDKKYILNTDNKVIVEKTSIGTLKSIIIKNQKDAYSDRNNFILKEDKMQIQYKDNTTQNNQNVALTAIPTYEHKLMQQGLLTKYPQMTAEKAVSEIKRLREKQIELLSGSWEGTYMNTTVDYMYKQLDEIINSYVSLFTGVETISQEEFYFVIKPEKPIILEEDLIIPVCKFSSTNGLLDLNEKGEGIQINARIHSYVSTDENSKNNVDRYITSTTKRKLDKDGVGVYYCTPQTVKITLQATDMINVSKMVKLMQYGNVSFTTDYSSNILFDEHSGEILKMW